MNTELIKRRKARTTGGAVTDTVFIMLLFLIFTASVLLVLFCGANVYRDTVSASRVSYEQRTGLSYVSTKIHSYDNAGAVTVGKVNNINTLILTENIKTYNIVTYIYYYDGYIREAHVFAGTEIEPDEGEEIIPAKGLEFEEINDSLVRAIFTFDKNEKSDIFVGIRTVSEVAK